MKEVYILFKKGQVDKPYGVLETRQEAERHKRYLEYKRNCKFRIEVFNVGLPQSTLDFEELHGVSNEP